MHCITARKNAHANVGESRRPPVFVCSGEPMLFQMNCKNGARSRSDKMIGSPVQRAFRLNANEYALPANANRSSDRGAFRVVLRKMAPSRPQDRLSGLGA